MDILEIFRSNFKNILTPTEPRHVVGREMKIVIFSLRAETERCLEGETVTLETKEQTDRTSQLGTKHRHNNNHHQHSTLPARLSPS